MGAVEGQRPVPHPDKDSDLPGKLRRRPSHFRKKKRQHSTTKLVRVPRDRKGAPSDISHVVQSPRARQEQWSEVINPAPPLPDPALQRPIPPPAPLPSESSGYEPTVPGWLEDRARRKRVEDLVGTLVLGLMVAAMLVAMWLRMTGP